jgi:hypothetical protein
MRHHHFRADGSIVLLYIGLVTLRHLLHALSSAEFEAARLRIFTEEVSTSCFPSIKTLY